MKLTVQRVSRRRLSPDQIEATWQCYRRFVDCPRESFVETLLQADDVYLCHTETGHVAGFEAIKAMTVAGAGHRSIVIYTLYADLDPRFRGTNILQKIGIFRFLSLRLRHPLTPIYWMFTASTYTSYLLLPKNLVRYWPRPGNPMPASALAIIDEVMRAMGADDWDPDAGVLKRVGALRYREGVVADDASVVDDPDVRFYAQLNPGQAMGDSLVCLCPLSVLNLVSVLANIVRRWLTRMVRFGDVSRG